MPSIWLRTRRRRWCGHHWLPVVGILEIDSAQRAQENLATTVSLSALFSGATTIGGIPAGSLHGHGTTRPRYHGDSTASQALRWLHHRWRHLGAEAAASHDMSDEG